MELGAILQFAGSHGPLLAVIALLLRSSAKKDDIIESLTAQALAMVSESRSITTIVKDKIKGDI